MGLSKEEKREFQKTVSGPICMISPSPKDNSDAAGGGGFLKGGAVSSAFLSAFL